MKKPDRYFYPAVFTFEPGREIAVVFPDLDCATSGENEDDALLSARECLGCVLHGLEEDGEEIPAPTPLTQIKTKENERADQLANLRSCSISIQDNAPLFMNRTERSFSWRGNDTAPPTACRRSTYMSCGIPL